MKKLSSISLILLIVLTQYSCQNSNGKMDYNIDTSEFRTDTVNNLYSIHVPGDMKKTNTLNPDANLQLENIYEEKYLAVIDEDKTAFINNFRSSSTYADSLGVIGNYRTIQLAAFTSGMTIKRRGPLEKLEINGMPAERIELIAFPAGLEIDIYYLVTFIEGADQLYMFLEWTLGSKKEEFGDTYKYIVETFEEL